MQTKPERGQQADQEAKPLIASVAGLRRPGAKPAKWRRTGLLRAAILRIERPSALARQQGQGTRPGSAFRAATRYQHVADAHQTDQPA